MDPEKDGRLGERGEYAAKCRYPRLGNERWSWVFPYSSEGFWTVFFFFFLHFLFRGKAPATV